MKEVHARHEDDKTMSVPKNQFEAGQLKSHFSYLWLKLLIPVRIDLLFLPVTITSSLPSFRLILSDTFRVTCSEDKCARNYR